MNNRDTDLKNIRPSIPTIIEEDVTSLEEQFQNRTLRPILKLQNEMLLQIFKHFLQKRKNKYFEFSIQKKMQYIQNTVRNDLTFRNLMTGIIIGHFTKEEWIQYTSHEKELRRRIISLIIQRLQSQVEQISISS